MKHSNTPRKWKTINLNTSNSDAILPNIIYMADLSDHYKIYDYAQIVNISSEDATIILNGSQKQPLPAGNQVIISRPFNAIAIKNNGANNISINDLQINYGYTSTKSNFINNGINLGSWVGTLLK